MINIQNLYMRVKQNIDGYYVIQSKYDGQEEWRTFQIQEWMSEYSDNLFEELELALEVRDSIVAALRDHYYREINANQTIISVQNDC